MKAGENVWVNWSGERVRSEDWPAETRGDRWFPCYPESRVHGDSYTPYPGRTVWQRAANEAMSSAAQSNFQRKSGW